MHNTQPWHWCITDKGVSLFADHARQLKHADPDARDLVISCGTALHHFQVAAAASGWKAVVKRMPNPYNDAQLANISFRPQEPTSDDLAALDALRTRRTDRRHPTSAPVPRHQLDRLLALAPTAGVTAVAVVSHRARTQLLRIIAEADRAQRLNPDYVDEIVGWTGRGDDQGIPVTSLLRRESNAGPGTPPSRFPSGTLTDRDRGAEPVEPALLSICTSSDDTASRLRAGEALGAILLKGTAEGLAMVPLSQAIEVDRTRRLLQDELLEDAACPQILVQVGMAPGVIEQIPLTPRRPVDEVLGDIDSLPPWLGPYA